MRCVSRWQSSSNRAPRNPAQQRAQWHDRICSCRRMECLQRPRLAGIRRLRAGNAQWCGYLVPWRTFTRSAPASVWPTMTCASDRWDNRRSAPGWAGQQQTAAGLTDPSAGGVAIPYRRLNVDVRAIARPIVLLAFAAIFRRAMASIRETCVMVGRLQRLPHCRRTISPRSERPSKAWRDRSQARACWSSVVNLDHGRTWGHPGTAWPNGNNPHISASHRQLELPCLCCDPRCKHDRRPNARFSERRPELAAPPQQLRKVVRKDAIERLLSRDSP